MPFFLSVKSPSSVVSRSPQLHIAITPRCHHLGTLYCMSQELNKNMASLVTSCFQQSPQLYFASPPAATTSESGWAENPKNPDNPKPAKSGANSGFKFGSPKIIQEIRILTYGTRINRTAQTRMKHSTSQQPNTNILLQAQLSPPKLSFSPKPSVHAGSQAAAAATP